MAAQPTSEVRTRQHLSVRFRRDVWYADAAKVLEYPLVAFVAPSKHLAEKSVKPLVPPVDANGEEVEFVKSPTWVYAELNTGKEKGLCPILPLFPTGRAKLANSIDIVVVCQRNRRKSP